MTYIETMTAAEKTMEQRKKDDCKSYCRKAIMKAFEVAFKKASEDIDSVFGGVRKEWDAKKEAELIIKEL